MPSSATNKSIKNDKTSAAGLYFYSELRFLDG